MKSNKNKDIKQLTEIKEFKEVLGRKKSRVITIFNKSQSCKCQDENE